MPEISAQVVNEFKENAHKGHIYKPGDVYPAEGFAADEQRLYFLTDVHPKYKKIYLADVTIHEEEKQTEDGQEAKIDLSNGKFPKHTGGGWYELSNGEKVQGKDEAIEAQSELKRGE